jgi:hypothetical protein
VRARRTHTSHHRDDQFMLRHCGHLCAVPPGPVSGRYHAIAAPASLDGGGDSNNNDSNNSRPYRRRATPTASRCPAAIEGQKRAATPLDAIDVLAAADLCPCKRITLRLAARLSRCSVMSPIRPPAIQPAGAADGDANSTLTWTSAVATARAWQPPSSKSGLKIVALPRAVLGRTRPGRHGKRQDEIDKRNPGALGGGLRARHLHAWTSRLGRCGRAASAARGSDRGRRDALASQLQGRAARGGGSNRMALRCCR